MIDLLFQLLIPVWVECLRRWHHWWLPLLLVAISGALERPVPEPATSRLRARDLTVRDTGWGTKDYPTVAYELVTP